MDTFVIVEYRKEKASNRGLNDVSNTIRNDILATGTACKAVTSFKYCFLITLGNLK